MYSPLKGNYLSVLSTFNDQVNKFNYIMLLISKLMSVLVVGLKIKGKLSNEIFLLIN